MMRPERTVSRRSEAGRRGVALIGALLLMTLMMLLGFGMVLATSSDMLINGYYRNFRGSFYAADSGLAIARQRLVTEVMAAVPPTFAVGAQPLSAALGTTVQTTVTNAYSGDTAINPSSQGSVWSGRFRLVPQGTNPPVIFTLAPNSPTATASNGPNCNPAMGIFANCTGLQYVYNYTIRSHGSTSFGGDVTIEESGSMIFNATITPSGPVNLSFAAWGMFIDQYNLCSGTLVPGTISGPAFTNGGWTFGTSGQYIFTDPVGSVEQEAGFDFSRVGCLTADADSYRSRSQTIAPNFQAGFNRGENAVPLPQNDFSQKRAVLDGQGTDTSPVTNGEMAAVLKDVTGAAYSPSNPAGVYLPVDNIGGVQTVVGGGIYVRGDASVVLSTSGASGQVFTITQGGTVTTITVDPQANTTTFSSGGVTQVLAGVPTNLAGGVPSPATMLYVDGNISSLRGPGQGIPAVNDGAAITITAAANVTITGDILYKTQPVTKVQDEIPGAPADTLIPGSDTGQVLGIFTATGDIRLNNQQANGLLEIDASLATISQGGTGGLINAGSQINTLTVVGGRIQNNIKNINSVTRNVFFDRRFSNPGFSPPWFPSTTYTPPGTVAATVTPSVQRTRWANLTAY